MITDPRFSSVKRFENKRELEDLIEDGLREADTEHWWRRRKGKMWLRAGSCNSLDQTIKSPRWSTTEPSWSWIILRWVKSGASSARSESAGAAITAPPPTLGYDEVLRNCSGARRHMLRGAEQEEMWKLCRGAKGGCRCDNDAI